MLLAGLSSGAWVIGFHENHDTKERQELTDTLESKLPLLNEAVTASIEQIRLRALSNAAHPSLPILHWGIYSLSQENFAKPISTAWNRAISLQGRDESFLKKAQAQWNRAELLSTGSTITVVRHEPLNRNEWLALAFRIPGDESRFTAAFVEPQTIFSALFKAREPGPNAVTRAYAITQDGNILLHTQPSYVATNFSDTGVFRVLSKTIWKDHHALGRIEARSIDQTLVIAAFAHIKHTPIALVLESQAPQGGLTLVTRRLLKPILLIMIALLLGGAAIRAVHEQRSSPKKAIAIAMPTPQILVPQMPLKRLRRAAPAPALVLWTSEARAEELAKAFEAASQIIDDPQKTADQLTRTVADISNGPTLFFAYHARIQAAVLESDAGFSPQENASFAMAFPIHKDALTLIVQSARERKLASLATYPPLSKVLLDRIGIAHFEAWALTTFARIDDPEKIPALLGILVILQAGVQSTEQRPSIVKTMRAASLAYERTSRPQNPALGTRATGTQAPPRGAQRLSPPV